MSTEREMFEAWALSDAGGWWPEALTRVGDAYKAGAVNKEWKGWQARASIASAMTPAPAEPADQSVHQSVHQSRVEPTPTEKLAELQKAFRKWESEGGAQRGIQELRAQKRLDWLHSPASHDVDGYEWGIYRVKWGQNGEPPVVLQTYSDFSDLDAAIGVAPPLRGEGSASEAAVSISERSDSSTNPEEQP